MEVGVVVMCRGEGSDGVGVVGRGESGDGGDG